MAAVLLSCSAHAFAAIDLTSVSSGWSTVLQGDIFDAGNDQQAAAAIDVLGNATYPMFYMEYDDLGTPGNTLDDEVAFRFRGDKVVDKQSDFKGYLWIGLDFDHDTAIDAFMVLYGDAAGGAILTIYDSDASLNTSPSTTALDAASAVSVNTGFSFSHVLAPDVADIDGDGDNDYIVSYKVNFSALATALDTTSLSTTGLALSTLNSGAGVDVNTPFSLVASSAQQVNSLNGDLGGYGVGDDDTVSYAVQGATSATITFTNLDPAAPSQTTITASPATVVADGFSSSTITVQAIDAIGNNVTRSSGAVILSSTGSATVSAVTDNNDGTYTATVTDTVAEVVTISGTINGSAITDTASVTFTSPADATPPIITLLGSDPVSIELGGSYTDAGATALDNIDGDLTGSIVTVNPVNTAVEGSYTVTYNVSDSAGNAAAPVTRTVNVTADATAPVITLLGSDPVSIELGGSYTDAGATALDNIDGDLTGSIVTVSSVNTAVEGSYTVTYNVLDAAGNAASQVSRTVNVTADATPPVIALLGSDPVSIELGGSYTDAGATALDNIDGDLTGSIVTVNPVNTAVEGSYTVTYNVTDSAGNAAAPVTRTVNVTADVTAPVITPIGTDPVSIELGGTYTDDGATALDNIDGDLTGSIVTVNPVNTAMVGSYTVTYNVADSAGNAAAPVTRTVNVTADATAPVITLLGSDPVSIELGSSYTDAGATALDNIDGDLTAGIVTVNPVNTAVEGSYTVTYNVTDSAGNAAIQVTRTVNVTADATAPVITLIGTDPVSIELGSTYTDAGATALDNIDGDLTGSIVTVSSVNTAVEGSYTVTYNVLDAAGNAAIQVTRTVDVTADTTPPVITLIGSDTVSIELGGSYTDAGATALDNIDGDLTGSIVTVNPVNTAVEGSYTVTYNVTDAAGNAAAQVSRTVNVTADATPPVIALLGSDPVSIELGGSYTDAGATALDNIDGNLTGSIVTVNTVDPTTLGSYTVTYNVSDAAGNDATEITRTVNVVLNLSFDEDGDGISNGDEGTSDTDGDGIADYLDLDSDNDGIADSIEGAGDSDADGVPDWRDLDSDNDGLYDLTESGLVNLSVVDSDNDGRIDSGFGSNGLADIVETIADSGAIGYIVADSDEDGLEDFRDLDSDNDGLFDVTESNGSDDDNDGIIGIGVPVVDIDGLAAGAGLNTVDSDSDGVADFRDLDSDNDGIYDVVEAGGTDANGDGIAGDSTPVVVNSQGVPADGGLTPMDTDGDGVKDQRDRDSDNDGIPDVSEAGGYDGDGDGIIGTGTQSVDGSGVVSGGGGLVPVDTDSDGVADQLDPDADGDGVSDIAEAGGIDSNGDGVVDVFIDDNGDGYDDVLATAPLTLPDSDGDGIPDFQDQNDADYDGIPDAQDLDDDNDGIPDQLEGNGGVDTDNDGVPDSLDLDSDNDGIFDLAESGTAAPTLLDSDNDGRIDDGNNVGSNGLPDVIESSVDSGVVGYNGGSILDTDNDGVANFRDLDSDNDGITDVIENGGSDPDNDGSIGSGMPVVNTQGVTGGAGTGIVDSDGDGTPDYLDPDSDNDGLNDLVEVGGSDADGDGVVDSFTDVDGDGYDDRLSQVPLSLLDTDGNGEADYIQVGSNSAAATNPIRTGLTGVGGCTVSSGAPFDPMLPLLLLLSLVALNRRKILAVMNGEEAK